MINFIDSPVQMHLLEMWEATVAAGEDAFVALFDERLDPKMATSAWARIGGLDKVQVRSVWNPVHTTESDTIIAVEYEDDGVEHGFVANAYEPNTDSWSVGMQTIVGIYIWSKDKNVVRVLNAWAMGAMLAGTKWFIQAGAAGVFYLGSGDIGPERRLLPDGGNSYMKLQRWRFHGVSDFRRPGGPAPSPPKWVTVHDSREIVGAYRDAVSGEDIPLADTLPGGAKPLK